MKKLLLVVLFLLVITIGFAQTWSIIEEVNDGPSAEGGYGLTPIYDESSNVIFVTKKMYPDDFNDELWKFDLNSNEWTQLSADNWPTGKYHRFAYNPINQSIMTWWAGIGQLYEIPIQGGSWTQVGNNSNSSSYYGHSQMWDYLHGELLLFAGYGWFTYHNELRRFNSNNAWEVISANGTLPDARSSAHLVGNETGEIAYMSGGGGWVDRDGNGEWNDLWKLDLTTYTWYNLEPTNSFPIDELCPSMTYNSQNKKLYFFGGGMGIHAPNQNYSNGLWSYDTEQMDGYEEVQAMGPPPTPRSSQIFYDSSNDRIIAFYGQDTDGWIYEMWELTFGGLAADFTSDVTSGQSPLTVNFSDQSTPADSIVSWQWDLDNDGIIDSYEQNPTLIYEDIGTYSVSLTVSDVNNSTDTVVKDDYINVVEDGNYSLDFLENTRILIPYSPNINDYTQTGQFTLSMWIKPTGNMFEETWNGLWGKYAGSFNDDFWISVRDNFTELLIRNQRGAQSDEDWIVNIENLIELNEWNHIELDFDSAIENKEWLYINGTKIGEHSISAPSGHNIGMYFFGSIEGIVDEIHFSKSIRHEINIDDFEPNIIEISDTNTIGLWHLDENSGNVVSDCSENGNDGTIDGAIWSTDVPVSDNHFTSCWTGNGYSNMTIFIESATIDGTNMGIDDEIGVFDGDLCVGAGVLTDEIPPVLQIVVSADDPQTTEIIDGFIDGNEISFRLWDTSTGTEITYIISNYSLGDGNFLQLGTAMVSLDGFGYVEQDIDLISGWNMLSFYNEPEDMGMLAIMQALIDNATLVKVQNESGQALVELPEIGWYNGIGDMMTTEGYYINVNSDTQLSTLGYPVTLPLEIPLISGWNMISYPCQSSQDAEDVVQSLIDAEMLVKVQNEAGLALVELPEIGWYNGIGDFVSGEGYYLNVNSDAVLIIYEPADDYVVRINPGNNEKKQSNQKRETINFHPVWNNNPYLAMNIYIPNIDLNTITVETGDELGVFDGEICVGSTTITNGEMISLIASTDNPLTDVIDGFEQGNEMSFKYWDSSEEIEYTDFEITTNSGSETFTSLGTSLKGLLLQPTNINNASVPVVTELYPNTPNPFNPTTTISFSLSEPGKVEIDVFNLKGQLVRTLLNNSLETGNHNVIWDGTDTNNRTVSSGVYLYRMKTDFKVSTKKMILLK